MPTSVTSDDVKDFEVDPGIKVGLDALRPEDRRAVEEAIRSKESFLARISDPSQVFRLRPKDPYIALKVTPRLRLIYTREGDRIQVVDLMNQGFLDRYATLQIGPVESAPEERGTSAQGGRRGFGEGAE
jgi:hypothetical protein